MPTPSDTARSRMECAIDAYSPGMTSPPVRPQEFDVIDASGALPVPFTTARSASNSG